MGHQTARQTVVNGQWIVGPDRGGDVAIGLLSKPPMFVPEASARDLLEALREYFRDGEVHENTRD
jgi:hypothetical protein